MALTPHDQRLDTIVAVIAIVLAGVLVVFGRGTEDDGHALVAVEVTVVPADAQGLACASDQRLGQQRCGHDGSGARVAQRASLRPFVTTGRTIVLLANFFETPAIRHWLAEAQRHGTKRRVTASCAVRPLGTIRRVGVRFRTDAPFQSQYDVAAGTVDSCVLQAP